MGVLIYKSIEENEVSPRAERLVAITREKMEPSTSLESIIFEVIHSMYHEVGLLPQEFIELFEEGKISEMLVEDFVNKLEDFPVPVPPSTSTESPEAAPPSKELRSFIEQFNPECHSMYYWLKERSSQLQGVNVKALFTPEIKAKWMERIHEGAAKIAMVKYRSMFHGNGEDEKEDQNEQFINDFLEKHVVSQKEGDFTLNKEALGRLLGFIDAEHYPLQDIYSALYKLYKRHKERQNRLQEGRSQIAQMVAKEVETLEIGTQNRPARTEFSQLFHDVVEPRILEIERKKLPPVVRLMDLLDVSPAGMKRNIMPPEALEVIKQLDRQVQARGGVREVREFFGYPEEATEEEKIIIKQEKIRTTLVVWLRKAGETMEPEKRDKILIICLGPQEVKRMTPANKEKSFLALTHPFMMDVLEFEKIKLVAAEALGEDLRNSSDEEIRKKLANRFVERASTRMGHLLKLEHGTKRGEEAAGIAQDLQAVEELEKEEGDIARLSDEELFQVLGQQLAEAEKFIEYIRIHGQEGYPPQHPIHNTCKYFPEIAKCRDIKKLLHWFACPEDFIAEFGATNIKFLGVPKRVIRHQCFNMFRFLLLYRKYAFQDVIKKGPQFRKWLQEEMRHGLRIRNISAEPKPVLYRIREKLDKETRKSLNPPVYDVVMADDEELRRKHPREKPGSSFFAGAKAGPYLYQRVEKGEFIEVEADIPVPATEDTPAHYIRCRLLILSKDNNMVDMKSPPAYNSAKLRGKDAEDPYRYTMAPAHGQKHSEAVIIAALRDFFYRNRSSSGQAATVRDAVEKRKIGVKKKKRTPGSSANSDGTGLLIRGGYDIIPLRRGDEIDHVYIPHEGVVSTLEQVLIANSKFTNQSHARVYTPAREKGTMEEILFPEVIYGEEVAEYRLSGFDGTSNGNGPAESREG